MISSSQIQQLYDKYQDLIELEIKEFSVKPTEVRHLIGRLGEFYCALQTKGTLAHTPNQHGFDVISKEGRRISVKTTAQKSGFVSIGKSTLDSVDEIMIVHYRDGCLSTLYHGPVKPAIEAARYYQPSGKYELDISKVKKLAQSD